VDTKRLHGSPPLLGFAGPVTLDESSSRRGLAFARELLLGIPFAEAWLRASITEDPGLNDHPVALGVGVDVADAERVLNVATVGAIPGPRTPGVPAFAMRTMW
jgi:hypothetical protein